MSILVPVHPQGRLFSLLADSHPDASGCTSPSLTTRALSVSIFSRAYWPLVRLLWTSVCSSPSPIFEPDYLFVVESQELFMYSEY